MSQFFVYYRPKNSTFWVNFPKLSHFSIFFFCWKKNVTIWGHGLYIVNSPCPIILYFLKSTRIFMLVKLEIWSNTRPWFGDSLNKQTFYTKKTRHRIQIFFFNLIYLKLFFYSNFLSNEKRLIHLWILFLILAEQLGYFLV